MTNIENEKTFDRSVLSPAQVALVSRIVGAAYGLMGIDIDNRESIDVCREGIRDAFTQLQATDPAVTNSAKTHIMDAAYFNKPYNYGTALVEFLIMVDMLNKSSSIGDLWFYANEARNISGSLQVFNPNNINFHRNV